MGFCLVSFFKHYDKNPARRTHWISQRVQIIEPTQWNPPFWKKLHFLAFFCTFLPFLVPFCSFFVGPFSYTFCHFLALDGPLLHFLALFLGWKCCMSSFICHYANSHRPFVLELSLGPSFGRGGLGTAVRWPAVRLYWSVMVAWNHRGEEVHCKEEQWFTALCSAQIVWKWSLELDPPLYSVV